MLVPVFIIHVNKVNCKLTVTKKAQMFVYYTSKILFVLYDNCDIQLLFVFIPYVCFKQDSVKLKIKSQMILYFDNSTPALRLLHPNYS